MFEVFYSILRKRTLSVLQFSAGVLLAAILQACSSDVPDPFAQKEARTFELGRVESLTYDVESSTHSNTKNRQVLFQAKLTNMATQEPVVDGLYFSVFEGFKKITSAKVINGSIEWSKDYTYDKGVPQKYTVYEFQIVAELPHRGVQKKRIGVNPDRRGREAAIDLSARGKLPLSLALASPASFQVQSIDLLSTERNNLSPSTQKFRNFKYNFYMCLYSMRENLPKVKDNRKFSIKTINGFTNKKEQIAKTNREGCLTWIGEIKDFNFYEPERWFPKQIEICSKNKEAAACILHTLYIHPWSAVLNNSTGFIFERGKSWKETRNKPAEEKLDGKVPTEDWEQRQASILLDNYAFGFTSRHFNIDNYLDISSTRNYEIVMNPYIKRWTLNGYAKEPLSGKYKVNFLLNRTHGESLLAWKYMDDSIEKKLSRKCFLSKNNIMEEFADSDTLRECLLWSNLDYGTKEVNIQSGVLSLSLSLKFPDIRYVESRNLIYFELKPINEEKTGITSNIFVGTIYPVLDSGIRRLKNIKDSIFVQPEGERFHIPDLENNIERPQKDLKVENPPKELESIAKQKIQNKKFNFSQLNSISNERANSLSIKEKIDYIKQENNKRLSDKIIFTKRDYSKSSLERYKYLYNLKTKKEHKEDNLNFPINEGKMEKLITAYREKKTENEIKEKIDDTMIKTLCTELYPINNKSQEEAKEYADYMRAIDQSLYDERTKILCEINNMVSSKATITGLENRDACQTTKRICDDSSTGDLIQDSLYLDSYNVLFGVKEDLQIKENCTTISEEERQMLQEIASMKPGWWKKATSSVGEAIKNKLEELRTTIFYERIQEKTTLQLLDTVFKDMSNKMSLYDPDNLNPSIPEHKKQLERYEPKIKQRRCIESPDDYLKLSLTKHIKELISADKLLESNIDSKNITISARIILSQTLEKSDSAEKALESASYDEVLNKKAVEATAEASANLRLVGAAGAKTSIGAQRALINSSGQRWHIRSIKQQTLSHLVDIGESQGRTINAEEISFNFSARVHYCLSARRVLGQDISKKAGIIYCSPEVKKEELTETWWHFYLYFRNKQSIIQDAAFSLTQRPWDAVVRGYQNYKEIIDLLQSRVDITMEKETIPNKILTAREFRYRALILSNINIPGLIEAKTIELQK